ncbi:MAG: polysaccharide biosynthesis/export family protein [Victivallaceae bacterium]|jgi:polysaccharide export outer membrane protein
MFEQKKWFAMSISGSVKVIGVPGALLIMCFLCGCAEKAEIPLAPTKEQHYEEIKVIRQDPLEIQKELEALQDTKPQPYHIAAGDKFDFKVYDNEDLNSQGLIVTPDGYISLSLIGPIKIGGMTVPEATKFIETKFAEYIRFPKVSLVPIRIQSGTFTISGKVNVPGRFPLRNEPRLTDAIAMARGFADGLFQGDSVEMADLKNSYITREGKILPVDFTKAVRGGDRLNNVPLRDGDYIFIASSMNETVYVVGEVGVPGYLGYKDKMTLMQAIAWSRGVLDTASSDAWIIRGGMVHPKVYKVDIDKVMRGRALDFHLEPNDVVFVPKDGLSQYNVVVKKILPTLEAINLIAGPATNLVK